MNEELIYKIKSVEIDCPDCSHIGGNDYNQYICTTCMCLGGEGKINVFDYIREHKEMLELDT